MKILEDKIIFVGKNFKFWWYTNIAKKLNIKTTRSIFFIKL